MTKGSSTIYTAIQAGKHISAKVCEWRPNCYINSIIFQDWTIVELLTYLGSEMRITLWQFLDFIIITENVYRAAATYIWYSCTAIHCSFWSRTDDMDPKMTQNDTWTSEQSLFPLFTQELEGNAGSFSHSAGDTNNLYQKYTLYLTIRNPEI